MEVSAEPRKGSMDPVGRAILYLRQHLREKVTLDHLADVVSLNKHHFCRLFHERTGLPPIEYFIHMKLDAAAWLLRESEWGQKQIAEHLALGDEYYFSRLFKQKKGISPREYRSGRPLPLNGFRSHSQE
jgi:transcriptional regulator GlxA family with amidase domain